jgi:hypothetical protein
MRLYQQTEGKRVGLHYLLPLYEQDTKAHAFLQQQMDLQDEAMNDFLGSLPKDLYATTFYTQTNGRYAPDRKQVYTRMPAHTKQFNSIDFSDEKLLYSVVHGVARYLLCHHGKFMNSQYEGLNASTDAIIKSQQ